MESLQDFLRLCSEIARSELPASQLLEKAIEACRSAGLSEDFARGFVGLVLAERERASGEKEGSGLGLREFASKAREMQESGIKVYRLELGEPDFSAPPSVIEAAYEAMKAGYSKYGPAAGIRELREAIASRLSERFGADLKAENIVVTAGGTFATYAAINVLTKPGDEVAVIEPAWPLYAHQARYLGRRVLTIRTSFEEDWDPVDKLQEKITKFTKLIIINYPNNPTGKILDRKSFEKLLEIAEDAGAWVVSDEVYIDFHYGGEPASALEFPSSKTLTLNSFSKTWGMTGWRIGYIVADPETAGKVAAAQNTAMTCIPEFVQRAALAALEDVESARRNVELIGRRLKILYEELSRSKLIDVKPPQGAMYIFPKIKVEGFDSWKFVRKLLEEKHVAVAPGASFGAYDNYLRISAVLDDEDLREACRRIREGVEEYGSS